MGRTSSSLSTRAGPDLDNWPPGSHTPSLIHLVSPTPCCPAQCLPSYLPTPEIPLPLSRLFSPRGHGWSSASLPTRPRPAPQHQLSEPAVPFFVGGTGWEGRWCQLSGTLFLISFTRFTEQLYRFLTKDPVMATPLVYVAASYSHWAQFRAI